MKEAPYFAFFPFLAQKCFIKEQQLIITFRNETHFMAIFFPANSARINTSPDIAYRQAVPLHDDRLRQQRGRIETPTENKQ